MAGTGGPLSPRSYVGVRPVTPSNAIGVPRDPTPRDWVGFFLLDHWINTNEHDPVNYQNVWILVSKRNNIAVWVKISTGSSGNIETLTASDNTIAFPFANNIVFPDQVIPGSLNVDSNIQSSVVPDLSDVFVINLKPVINLPNTNANGSVPAAGIIQFNGLRFVHNYGTGNTFLGAEAGNRTLTTAQQSVAVGTQALIGLTTGERNTAVGWHALTATTTGNGNIAVGSETLQANTTGGGNIAIGRLALSSNTTANGNLAIGNSALQLNTTGSANVAIGQSSLAANLTGINNTCVGWGSSPLSTASNNTCLGAATLSMTTTGDQNVAVGFASMQFNTTGNLHTAVGFAALNHSTTGTANTAIGSNALTTCTTGSVNTVVGNGAASAVTTGSNNTSIGVIAHQALTTGSYNTALGQVSGNAYTTENSNITIGNVGTVADTNFIRIGTLGTGNGQQNKVNIINRVEIATDGKVTINTPDGGNGTSALEVNGTVAIFSGDSEALDVYNQANNANAPRIAMLKARGNNIVQVGDALGLWHGFGWDGTQYLEGSGIRSTVDAVGVGTLESGLDLYTSDGAGVFPNRIRISATGIVTLNPAAGGAYTLVVAGNGGAKITGVYGVAVGATNAAVLVDNSGFFGTVPSSIRFKENVQDMADISSPLMKLRPVIFNFKEDENKTIQFGLIAEEVALHMPGIVNFDESGTPEGVRYHDMPAMLLNEIQKLNKRIEALEEKLCQNQVS